MNLLLTQVRATLLFYRSVAPFMLGLSGLFLLAVLLPGLLEGWWRAGMLPALLLAKLATAPVVWYLSEQLRPGQYWFYFNLHISRRQLWASVVALGCRAVSGRRRADAGCEVMRRIAPKSTGPQVLEADGIRIAFGGREVLASIYLRVQTGQIVGLLGRNGSGKSVLLQTIFGARAVADASVRVNGRRVVPAFREPGLLNYLPQEPLLPPSLTLARAARLLGVDIERATARFPELRPQFGLRLGELSGGSARLVQALLLLHADTAFSLFDEPFSGVMPVHVETPGRGNAAGESSARACSSPTTATPRCCPSATWYICCTRAACCGWMATCASSCAIMGIWRAELMCGPARSLPLFQPAC